MDVKTKKENKDKKEITVKSNAKSLDEAVGNLFPKKQPAKKG